MKWTALLSVIWFATGASAQTGPVDEGNLLVLRGADTIAVEAFTVERTLDGFEIRTTVYYPPTRSRVVVEGVLRVRADSAPQMLSVESGPARVLAQFGPRRVTFRRMSNHRESAREYPAAARTMVVHDSVFAFYAIPPGFLPGPVTIMAPATDDREPFELRDRGEEATRVAGETVLLRHVTLSAGNDVRHLWFRRARLVKVELPRQGLVIERGSLPPRRRQ